ncbi:MAG: helix-turn-helix domain-containing protein [Gammaproteobacteria bacterium]|nr:helix-turn-helix domain-containing protein [Gammaproteobacteria bacterium]MBU0785488.1 helix-turn-helix domain-containing protein [Gammaproteobacteria bacterium]MBU0813688.1 helix-turn-helix domain-containing protein [Gammaproteobacteria bacterium]MBU1788840.1 helix-turn-helix domain-containing protein [Gammaproteobacteria bacterium]
MNTHSPPPGGPEKGKALAPTKVQRAFENQPTRANFKTDLPQTQDGAGDPFARFRAVWSASIKPPSRKLVLLALTDFANADGTNIRPAVATIAARCGITPKQTRRHIHDLAELGVIKATKAAAQHRATVYSLDMLVISALPRAGDLKDASTPAGVPQHSRQCPPDLPPKGAYPGNHPGEDHPPGGGEPSGAGFAGPKTADPELWTRWARKSQWSPEDFRDRVARGNELSSKGHSLNSLIKQALNQNWRYWPRVDSAQSNRGSRYGENYSGKVWT